MKEDLNRQEIKLVKINEKITNKTNKIDKQELKISDLIKQLSEKLSKR